MKGKSKKSVGVIILSIIVSIVGLCCCIPLFINVWNATFKIFNSTTVENAGGFFDDYSDVKQYFKMDNQGFADWASMIAGIMLIVALAAAVLYTIALIVEICGKRNKSTKAVKFVSSLIMLIAGIAIVVFTLMFVIPATNMYSMSMGTGAILAIIFPTFAGLVGLLSAR